MGMFVKDTSVYTIKEHGHFEIIICPQTRWVMAHLAFMIDTADNSCLGTR